MGGGLSLAWQRRRATIRRLRHGLCVADGQFLSGVSFDIRKTAAQQDPWRSSIFEHVSVIVKGRTCEITDVVTEAHTLSALAEALAPSM